MFYSAVEIPNWTEENLGLGNTLTVNILYNVICSPRRAGRGKMIFLSSSCECNTFIHFIFFLIFIFFIYFFALGLRMFIIPLNSKEEFLFFPLIIWRVFLKTREELGPEKYYPSHFSIDWWIAFQVNYTKCIYQFRCLLSPNNVWNIRNPIRGKELNPCKIVFRARNVLGVSRNVCPVRKV